MFYFSTSLEERVPFLELSGLLEVSFNFFYFHKKCTTFEILGIAGSLSLEMSTEAESKDKHGLSDPVP
jgi:hypothetical protein